MQRQVVLTTALVYLCTSSWSSLRRSTRRKRNSVARSGAPRVSMKARTMYAPITCPTVHVLRNTSHGHFKRYADLRHCPH